MLAWERDLKPLRAYPVESVVQKLALYRSLGLRRAFAEFQLLQRHFNGLHARIEQDYSAALNSADNVRLAEIEEARTIYEGRPSEAYLHLHLTTPVHPALLAGIIAVWLLSEKDPRLQLTAYVSGQPVHDLEFDYLQPERIAQDYGIELLAFLDKEAEVLTAIENVGLQFLRSKRRRLLKPPLQISRLDIWACAWFALNPAWDLVDRTFVWARGFQYGFSLDQRMHSARAYYERRTQELSLQIDSAAGREGGVASTEIRELLVRRKLSSRLARRAKSVYYWSPHEIDAYAGEIQHAFGLVGLFRSGVSGLDEETVRRRYHKFLLPNELVEEIQAGWQAGQDAETTSEPYELGQ
jgi:hypothetical protein